MISLCCFCYRESLFNIVSGIYAMVLIVLGVTLPLAQICAHDLHTIIFEVSLPRTLTIDSVLGQHQRQWPNTERVGSAFRVGRLIKPL